MKIQSGILDIGDYESCNIRNNGQTYNNVTSNTMLPLLFGLIEYVCDNMHGTLVSKLECKKCDIYCIENELITGCEQFWIPLVFGIILGLIPTLILFIALRRVVVSLISRFCEWVMYKYTIYKDNKNEAKANKIMLMTNQPTKPIYKPKINTDLKYLTKIDKKRGLTQSEIPEYITIMADSTLNEDGNNDANIESESRPTIHGNTGRSSVYPPIPILIICFVFFPLMCLACDNTLFISSVGKVCDDMKCSDSRVYDIPLKTGSTICFKDLQGKVMKIRIKESYYINRYYLQYYTSDYKIVVNTHSSCKGSGNCWDGGCKVDTVDRTLLKMNEGPIVGYGCETNALGCNSLCFYQLSCSWYMWAVYPKGLRYPVYTLSSTIWENKITMEYNGEQQEYVINVNNPSANVDRITGKLPIFVTSFEGTRYYNYNGLIIVDGLGYPVKAAATNYPESDIIGDLQISLEGNTTTINTHTIDCRSESCEVICRLPKSKLKRFINSDIKGTEMEIKNVVNKYSVETKQFTNAYIKMSIGNVDFENLQVNLAQCKIGLLDTYSCTGCIQEPYAILGSTYIINEGIIPFISNCTFDVDYVSCSPNPYKLILSENQEYCSIYMPSINQTLDINFKFKFKGQLSSSTSTYGYSTTVDAVQDLVTNKNFITSLFGTVTTFGILGVVASLITKIAKIWQINYTLKKCKEAIIEP